MAFMEGTLGVVIFVYLVGIPAMCKDSGEVSGEELWWVAEFVLPGSRRVCLAGSVGFSFPGSESSAPCLFALSEESVCV